MHSLTGELRAVIRYNVMWCMEFDEVERTCCLWYVWQTSLVSFAVM